MAAGSNAAPLTGSIAARPHASTRLDRADTEELPVAPAEGADRRTDLVCPQKREPLAIRREVGRERGGVRREDEPLRVSRPFGPDGSQDRVGL